MSDSNPNKQSVKSLIKCPFVIRFSILGIKKKTKAAIFHIVNITHVNPRHKCTSSNVSFRTTTRTSKSTTKLDLYALKAAIECVKLDPHLPAVLLRPLLSSCLPPNIELSSAYLSRFHRRCQSFLASGDDFDSTSNNIGNRLLSTTDLSQDEIDV